jgi:predicted dehydrogenase
MHNPIRLGVIGTGYLGRIHVRLARDLKDAELVGAADPDPAARERIETELGVATFADYRTLAEQVDAAIVAAPTPLHLAIGLDLLDRGLHVLMEKPLAASAEQAARLADAADRSGAVLQVGHVERFNPALAAARPHLSQPKYIEAVRYTPYTFRSTDVGVVLDLMIHDLDIVLSLLPGASVRSVEALGVSVLSRHEDVAQARLVFDNGAVANVSASRVSYAARREMQIWTPDGFASVDFAQRSASVVRPSSRVAQRRFDEAALGPDEKERLKGRLFDELLVREELACQDRNAIADEQADFIESIQRGRSPHVTGRQGHRALVLAEQVLAGVASHRWDGRAAGRIGPLAEPASPVEIPYRAAG